MNLTGKIIKVEQLRSGSSAKGAWATQDYLIETIEQYPRKCLFNVFGEDKIKKFALKEGDIVTVHLDINAREYNGRWYNDIRVWKVERPTQSAPSSPVNATTPIPSPADMNNIMQQVDDMPF